MALIEKNVTTLTELKTLVNQGNKAAVLYDVSTGEAYGLDLEVVINMDASISAKAADNSVVHSTGNETVAGVKTFSSSPIIPNPTTATQADNKGSRDAAIATEASTRDKRDKLLIYSNPTALTGVAHNDAAPTPAADTKYIFTTSGDCSWISAGTMNVIKGDEITCLVDAGVRTYVFLPNPSRSKDYYGVEWNMGAASSTLTRIGNMEWHRTLPVHSMMRRCVLNDAGEVVYYLSATDSTKKEDGSPALLDGTDGQVMVEIPRFYVALEQVGYIVRIKMSLTPFPNSIEIQKMYISAYEAALQRSTSKLSSVVNLSTDYRGGNNTSAWDASSNNLLGKPATNISLTNFRAYARNRGAKWNCNTYLWQKIMWWLLRVEYANLNDQLTYNSALTAEGYRQGGLGVGVTDIDSTKWNTFNGYNPFIPCGHTNLLGNATGVVAYAMPSEYDATIKTTYVPTYRGIENPFGHIWKWTDGVKVKIQSDSDGGLSELYVCPNPANYQDANYNNYIKRGLLPRSSGYGGKALFGTFGEMLPVDVIGSSTTYLCDYFYTSIPATGTEQRGLLFGGFAYSGASAGCASADSNSSPARANAVGSRLCFLNI
jgi:hypothetical protein